MAKCFFCMASGSLGTLSVTFLPQTSHQDESAPSCSFRSFRDEKAEGVWEECRFLALPHGVTHSPSAVQHMAPLL